MRYYAIVEMGLKPPTRLSLVVGKVEVGTAFILDQIDFGGYGYCTGNWPPVSPPVGPF